MTETKILACCKSAETSARVTVTILTRGSCISNRIVSAATSRMASATRASRWVFMVGNPAQEEDQAISPWPRGCGLGAAANRSALNFHVMVQQLRYRVAAQGGDDLLEDRPHVMGFVADHG